MSPDDFDDASGVPNIRRSGPGRNIRRPRRDEDSWPGPFGSDPTGVADGLKRSMRESPTPTPEEHLMAFKLMMAWHGRFRTSDELVNAIRERMGISHGTLASIVAVMFHYRLIVSGPARFETLIKPQIYEGEPSFDEVVKLGIFSASIMAERGLLGVASGSEISGGSGIEPARTRAIMAWLMVRQYMKDVCFIDKLPTPEECQEAARCTSPD